MNRNALSPKDNGSREMVSGVFGGLDHGAGSVEGHSVGELAAGSLSS
jgi:hypothetical protein